VKKQWPNCHSKANSKPIMALTRLSKVWSKMPQIYPTTTEKPLCPESTLSYGDHFPSILNILKTETNHHIVEYLLKAKILKPTVTADARERLCKHIVSAATKEHATMEELLEVVFLDIEKAFDATWHPGLLYKLSELEFPTSLIKLISSFFHNENSEFR
jgi:hypothetical protein